MGEDKSPDEKESNDIALMLIKTSNQNHVDLTRLIQYYLHLKFCILIANEKKF